MMYSFIGTGVEFYRRGNGAGCFIFKKTHTPQAFS